MEAGTDGSHSQRRQVLRLNRCDGSGSSMLWLSNVSHLVLGGASVARSHRSTTGDLECNVVVSLSLRSKTDATQLCTRCHDRRRPSPLPSGAIARTRVWLYAVGLCSSSLHAHDALRVAAWSASPSFSEQMSGAQPREPEAAQHTRLPRGDRSDRTICLHQLLFDLYFPHDVETVVSWWTF